MIKWSPNEGFNAAAISLDDHGVTVGDGIFESMRVTAFGVFALTRHIARLNHAANLIGIELPPKTAMTSAIAEVVGKLHGAGVTDARLRLTITSGLGPAGVMRGANINWFITAAPISIATSPAKLHTSRIIRNEYSLISSIKTLSYLENVIALNDAVAAGFDEALILNTKGEVVESATCNLLFEINDELVTPPLSAGALRGITRELLIEKFAVNEQVITKNELAQVSGAALLSSVRGVQHISHIDQRSLAGSLEIAKLAEKYQDLLNSPLEYQTLI
jgi:branched-chain amino acid aminotransferase